MKRLIALLVIFMAFALNTSFSQQIDSDKFWNVESYQGYSYNSTDSNAHLYFQEAYLHLNASKDAFNFNVSARVDADKTIGLYTANITYNVPVSDNKLSFKLGQFNNDWYTYTFNTFDNYTFAVPVSLQYGSVTKFAANEIGANVTFATKKVSVGASVLENTDPTSKALMVVGTTHAKNFSFGAMYYAPIAFGNSDLSKFSDYTFGGSLSFTKPFKSVNGKIKGVSIHTGAEFIYSHQVQIAEDTANTYVGSVYVAGSLAKAKNFSLLLKGDYYVPNADFTEVNQSNAAASLIWKPNTNTNIGLQYLDNLNSNFWSLSLRTGFNF